MEAHAFAVAKWTPILYIRYVDDGFSSSTSTNRVYEKFIAALNSFEQDLQFTYETEVDNQINFLDFTIKRDQNSDLLTTVYRKEIFSPDMIHWSADCPIKYKRAAITNLVFRALRYCNSYPLMLTEFSNIVKIARNRGYPQWLVDHWIKSTFHRWTPNTFHSLNLSKSVDYRGGNQSDSCSKRLVYLTIPYSGHSSTNMAKDISHLIPPTSGVNYRVVFQKTPQLSQLVNNSVDSNPFSRQTNVVYRYRCQDCESIYVGKTTQYLSKRIVQHGYPPSNIYHHVKVTGHRFDPESFSILHREAHPYKLSISESLLIKQMKPGINQQAGMHLHVF